MSSDKNKQKKHRHFWSGFGVFVVVLALVAFAGVQLERHIIANKAASIVAKAAPVTKAGKLADVKLAPSTPNEIADRLNSGKETLISASNGLIDDATANVNGSTVTYDVSSSKLSPLLVSTAMTTNGDQVQQMADKLLTSMKDAGTSNPKVVINVTDTNGNVIKSLTYTN
ncbi:hypothetical protein WOSG25_060620 [Weissella oryzae SG25]|uniref:Uncharacterized protein n=1 Tax=Weissella oryzae (strain DSM 25784 / JCM 18191 / LMG 30913 / SG25) TaxID=1329250 RepID=A0A069CU68_WEIOS|nr:hypothetical protein [Weissella oryzae]GAK30942.1 hypothetical protein WOSG25_060620 [Weissella oryzae SG25]